MPRLENIQKDEKPYSFYDKRGPRPAAAKIHKGELGKVGEDRDYLWTPEQCLQRYPRIVGHIICDSLGYAMPLVAARILANAMNGEENWCEWIYSCYGRDPRKAVRSAIERRQHHSGYMAEYFNAMVLIGRELEGIGDPNAFAAWF